jgi:ABC-2 type transport system ATP-binding protein
MIEAEGLSKRFDDFLAVREVSLTARQGQVLALLGPNGAGKTTTVRMFSSILVPSSGRARVAGFDVVTQARDVRRSIGLLTEHHGLYLRMHGDEYLDFFGELQDLPLERRRRRARELLERFGLASAAHRPVSEYSKGMRQKLALVRSLLHDPPVLLLDEPTSAMDPFSAKQVRDCIADLRREGRTILLCTHNLTEAEQLSDSIAIIRQGTIVAQGTSAELKARFLGEQQFVVRLAGPLDGLGELLRGLVSVDAAGRDWLRYHAPDWQAANPQVLARLAEHGARVLTLSPAERSLEEVYLHVVGESEGIVLHEEEVLA